MGLGEYDRSCRLRPVKLAARVGMTWRDLLGDAPFEGYPLRKPEAMMATVYGGHSSSFPENQQETPHLRLLVGPGVVPSGPDQVLG